MQRSKLLLCGAAAMALALPLSAHAEAADFNIAPQPLTSALKEFGVQSQYTIVAQPDVVAAKTSRGVTQSAEPEAALLALLEGTGLDYRREGDTFLIVRAGAPQSGSAAGAGAEVEALIVTAQKKEENIQDVPIAISAFSAKALEAQKIEGGFDLLKAIPNVTFSKNNFTSYNFSIRGIGTKAVSAATDPAVAVSFNNIALLQNRLFEQEYFDVERVEVLRGPQGTLYGRNATSGVINLISAKPDLNGFSGWLKGEVGNYDTKRVSAMVNVPLVGDVLAVRLAGALTDRQGYDFNTVTNNPVNGRELWSARLTVGFEPTERLRGNLIWERFEEDDNRSRTGKQLCHRDDGPESVGDVALADGVGPIGSLLLRRAIFAQGCKAGSLYDDAAFGTPNGLSYNFILGMFAIAKAGYPVAKELFQPNQAILKLQDPYDGMMQSRNLREIASFRDPIYRAKADLLELNLEFDLADGLTLYSQTAYNEDQTYSFQDYNRFNTVPIFTDTSVGTQPVDTLNGTINFRNLSPGGIYCDPQLGCSDTVAGFDIAQADGKQFTQEIRLQSSFDGPVNFSLGANYTKFDTVIDYYVMFNLLTAMAQVGPFNAIDIPPYGAPGAYAFCRQPVWVGPDPVPSDDPDANCPYIDPNPVESINGEGHNYFRSKNPYGLKSSAVFGELYWNARDDLKLTAGLRYTNDRKIFIPVPSQVLLAPGLIAGGVVAAGYPEKEPIKQEWGEWTGRFGVDWSPELAFTDKTMLYAFYSRGYKGGGANPPQPDFATMQDLEDMIDRGIWTREDYELAIEMNVFPILELTGVEYGPTFEPEFVNAFELGTKNTLLDGAMTLNLTAFYYDYTDYQVSQIRDRTAVNENFDAEAWGIEVETMFAPSRDLQIIANVGYLDTAIANGESSIDIMNRTQGNPDFVLTKPWIQLPSNCVVPVAVAESWANSNDNNDVYWKMCGGYLGILEALTPSAPIDPATGERYTPLRYDGSNGTVDINGGAGIRADLGGNELPNAPHWTANIGAQYGMDILDGWRATVRGDVYWQSQSYHRVYNYEPYDKLHGWYNANLSVWIERPDDGLKIELYAKNILNDTPITDAFLNSDDTGLTTNVFVLDPRLIGLSIRKEF